MVTWHAALASELGPAVGLAGGVVSCVQPQEPRGGPGSSSRRDGRQQQTADLEEEGKGGAGGGGEGVEGDHFELLNPFVEFTAIAATKVGAVSRVGGAPVPWGRHVGGVRGCAQCAVCSCKAAGDARSGVEIDEGYGNGADPASSSGTRGGAGEERGGAGAGPLAPSHFPHS